MRPSRGLTLGLVAFALAGLLAWKLYSSHFDWPGFWRASRSADPRWLLAGVALIYANYFLRAARWAVFLRPQLAPGERVRWWTLVPSQFVGFAGLAAFGRIGELIRPYLVARRTDRTFSSQIGVVAVERMFDMGAFALLFSLDLALSPGLHQLPYHTRFRLMGFAALGMIALLGVFVFAMRRAGAAIATTLAAPFHRRSGKHMAELVESRVLAFRKGLNAICGVGDFLKVALLSVVLWASIAASYVAVMHAFPAPVHGLTLAACVLLMGFSVAGSFAQLPGVGGGSQAAVIFALTKLFGIPAELGASAGLILWIVNTMSVIPAGLVLARAERQSLLSVARASRAAGLEAASSPAE